MYGFPSGGRRHLLELHGDEDPALTARDRQKNDGRQDRPIEPLEQCTPCVLSTDTPNHLHGFSDSNDLVEIRCGHRCVEREEERCPAALERTTEQLDQLLPALQRVREDQLLHCIFTASCTVHQHQLDFPSLSQDVAVSNVSIGWIPVSKELVMEVIVSNPG